MIFDKKAISIKKVNIIKFKIDITAIIILIVNSRNNLYFQNN